MKEKKVSKFAAGILMLLLCLVMVPKADAKAAFELNGRTYIDGVRDELSFQKVPGTVRDYNVIFNVKSQNERMTMYWQPSISGNTYNGYVTKVSQNGSAFISVNPGRITLYVTKSTGNRIYMSLNANGQATKGYLIEKEKPLSINKKNVTLYTSGSKTVQLKVTQGGKSKSATWSSSKKSVATVSKSGKVTAKKAGTTTITAKVNGKKLTCKVTVKKTSLKLNKKSATLKVGQMLRLRATVSGPSKKVTWSSSNSKVASVSRSGVVLAKKKGTVKITAKANGLKFTCKIKIK